VVRPAHRRGATVRNDETKPSAGEAGAVDARNFFRGFDLRHTLMIVPPLGTVVVAVTAGIVCGTGHDSGHAEADFASAGFQVGSPAGLFTILS
jgi:hypothetical protein